MHPCKIAVGTAQLGMKYGINNKIGQPSLVQAGNILAYAYKNGVDTIDTARNYGESESVIGKCLKVSGAIFKIVTKIPDCGAAQVKTVIDESLTALGQQSIYACVLHSYDSFEKDKVVYTQLQMLKDNGLVSKIGFSLYHPYELEKLLSDNVAFDLLQIPYSVFDRRFERFFDAVKAKSIELHTRSVFLQGIAFMEPAAIASMGLSNLSDKVRLLRNISSETGRSLANICLNFVKNGSSIDRMVVGVDSVDHLVDIMQEYASDAGLDPASLSCLQCGSEFELLPYNWSKK